MAKTLLHHYPKGHFEPVIFDSKPRVGGLWAVSSRRPDIDNTRNDACDGNNDGKLGQASPSSDFIDCFMRTNLSRFTVSFSDHAWNGNNEDDDDDALFPQAWQVGDYLSEYTARFLPANVLRLSSRVVRTQRNITTTTNAAGRWMLEWEDLKEWRWRR